MIVARNTGKGVPIYDDFLNLSFAVDMNIFAENNKALKNIVVFIRAFDSFIQIANRKATKIDSNMHTEIKIKHCCVEFSFTNAQYVKIT